MDSLESHLDEFSHDLVLVGDFNARVGNLGQVTNEETDFSVNTRRDRISADSTVNGRRVELMHLMSNHLLCILNRRTKAIFQAILHFHLRQETVRLTSSVQTKEG